MIRCHSKRTPGLGAPVRIVIAWSEGTFKNTWNILKLPWWQIGDTLQIHQHFEVMASDGFSTFVSGMKGHHTRILHPSTSTPAGNQALARQQVWQCALCPTIANSCRFSPFAHGCHLWSPGHRDCIAVLRRLSRCLPSRPSAWRWHGSARGQLLQNQFHNHLEPINVTWWRRVMWLALLMCWTCKESQWQQYGMQ